MIPAVIWVVSVIAVTAEQPAAFLFRESDGYLDVFRDGKIWQRTVTIPYDPGDRENTYKVYTHIYDFEGTSPITKGVGGKYTHHRGMFIGWKRISANEKTFNLWEMADGYQVHDGWLERTATEDKARQTQRVIWCTNEGERLIEEIRTIETTGKEGLRIFDFMSTLNSLAGTIGLRGDLHHAGMQVRLADEVSQHEETTQYILPDGAREEENDKVVGAWWVCCSAEVNGRRYWLMHMTPQNPCIQFGVTRVLVHFLKPTCWKMYRFNVVSACLFPRLN